MNQFLQQHKQQLVEFAKENDIKYLALFGSHARGEEKESSDVDLLVEYSPGTSLLDVVGMELELGDQLNKKIDLVSKKYVNKHIQPYIEKDLIEIYAQV
jgi:hypothetical protein